MAFYTCFLRQRFSIALFFVCLGVYIIWVCFSFEPVGHRTEPSRNKWIFNITSHLSSGLTWITFIMILQSSLSPLTATLQTGQRSSWLTVLDSLLCRASAMSEEEMERQQVTPPEEKKVTPPGSVPVLTRFWFWCCFVLLQSPSLKHYSSPDPLRTYGNRPSSHMRSLTRLTPRRFRYGPVLLLHQY